MSPPPTLTIIGAGAAGIVAAIRAAELGEDVLLLEKNSRPGLKILISGGGRCNVTHDGDARGVVQAFGEGGPFLRTALAAFPPAATRALLEAEGVPLYVEPDSGKVFPRSDKARDVLEALLARLRRSGARLECSAPVSAVRREGAEFAVETPGGTVRAGRVIVTTGGKSYAKTGTTGDGYRIAAAFGHTIVPPRPALVPLTSSSRRITGLAGIDLQDAEIRVLVPGAPRPVARRRAPILFTHHGISGPAAMDVSRVVSLHPGSQEVTVEIDVLPATPAEELDAWLRAEAAAGGRRRLATVLDSRTARRIADAALEAAGVPPERQLSELSREERGRVVRALKGLPAPVSGTLGFDKAEVTAGGVALDEVDPRTMESRKCRGLYFAGEVLDVDGWIGGYNFQAAFATGWAAGTAGTKGGDERRGRTAGTNGRDEGRGRKAGTNSGDERRG